MAVNRVFRSTRRSRLRGEYPLLKQTPRILRQVHELSRVAAAAGQPGLESLCSGMVGGTVRARRRSRKLGPRVQGRRSKPLRRRLGWHRCDTGSSGALPGHRVAHHHSRQAHYRRRSLCFTTCTATVVPTVATTFILQVTVSCYTSSLELLSSRTLIATRSAFSQAMMMIL